nr:muscarinic acetylcholine receptor M4-like [Lytechinus pictus]
MTTEVSEFVSSFSDGYFTEANSVIGLDDSGFVTSRDGLPAGSPVGPPGMPGGPPQPPFSSIGSTFSIVYSSIIIITNAATLFAFATERRLRTYNNLFLINLAISDLLVGVTVAANVINTYYPTVVMCKLHLALNDAFLTVSVFGIVAISIDRHQATYDPITHFLKKCTRRAVIFNVVIWLICLAIWLPYTAGWDLGVILTTPSQNDPFRDACVPRYGLRLVTSLLPVGLTIIIPAILITVLYVRIVYKIRTAFGAEMLANQFRENVKEDGETPQGNAPGSTSTEFMGSSELKSRETDNEGIDIDGTQTNQKTTKATKQRESAEVARKATRTLSAIIVAFVIAWLPHVIFIIVTNLNRDLLFEGKIPEVVLFLVSMMRYSNSFLNPISYAMAQPLFRQTVLNMFRGFGRIC